MLKEISRNMRIGKLDAMFLLIPTIFGLSLAISGSLMQSEAVGVKLVITGSLLMIAVVWPIYIGYVRGAIMDNILERARGWIYLSVGVVVYMWNMSVNFILVNFGFELDMNHLILNVGLVVFGIAVVRSFITHFPRKIGLRIMELAVDDTEYLTKYRSVLNYIFDSTGFASISLAVCFVILSMVGAKLFEVFPYLFGVVVLMAILCIIGFVYEENMARANRLVAHKWFLRFCVLSSQPFRS